MGQELWLLKLKTLFSAYVNLTFPTRKTNGFQNDHENKHWEILKAVDDKYVVQRH